MKNKDTLALSEKLLQILFSIEIKSPKPRKLENRCVPKPCELSVKPRLRGASWHQYHRKPGVHHVTLGCCRNVQKQSARVNAAHLKLF